jgi:hypothetical protein
MVDRVRLRPASPLPQPPLLVTESAEDFKRLHDQIEEEIQPRGIIEQMYVADMADIVWDIIRLRRCKAVIVNVSFRTALERLLTQLMREPGEIPSPGYIPRRQEGIEDLVPRWFTDENVKKQVADSLAKFQLDHFAIEAEAMRESLPTLELLERMLRSLEARRDRLLLRVGEYRAMLAPLLRESAERTIQNNSVRVLDRSTGKKSAA